MGSIIGGIVGRGKSQGDRDASMGAIGEAVENFRKIEVPTVEQQRIMLEMLQSQGVLTPELEQEILSKPTKFEEVSTDPLLREAQMNALKSLQEVGQVGLTAEDRAQVNQLRREVNREEQAKQAQILQSMAQRGAAGSGMELAARLSSAQASADRAAQESDRLAANALQRQLQAVAQSGQLGGSIRGQDFGEQAQKASAIDAINLFNTQTQQGVQTRNIGSKNEAQLRNLQEKQRISDTNVGLRNQQEQHNKALYQQRFQNEIAKAQGIASPLQAQSQAFANRAQGTADFYSGIGKGVDQGIMAAATGGASLGIPQGGGSGGGSGGRSGGGSPWSLFDGSDERIKENVKKVDTKELLDKLSAVAYNYKKDPAKEKKVGIMAQDLEKSELGKTLVVEDENGIKGYNKDKALSAALAALADLNKRLNKLEGKKNA